MRVHFSAVKLNNLNPRQENLSPLPQDCILCYLSLNSFLSFSQTEDSTPNLISKSIPKILTNLGLEENKDFDRMSLDQAPKMEEYFDLSMYGSTETGEDPDDENDYYYTRERYWYHPNYLGNVDMITNDNGHIHQYFVYSPFGENMYQYNRNSDFDSRYRFNGKEIDEETGNGYYGARYYNPKISVWLSVDPLAHEYPNLSPYNFAANNPILLFDPNGESIWATKEAWGIINESMIAILGRKQDIFSYNSEEGKVEFNKNADLSELKPEQKEFVDRYKSLIEDEDFDLNVQVVDRFELLEKGTPQETSLDKKNANGLTVYRREAKTGKQTSTVYLGRICYITDEEGNLKERVQQDDWKGLTSIHEIGGHTYLYQQGVLSEYDNNRQTEKFETRMRQKYKRKYLIGYIKGEANLH